MKEWIAYKPNDYSEISGKIIKSYPSSRVFAFYGDMGAGKTTLIKTLCSTLGVEGTANSPSFAIVNNYTGKDNILISHFDFFRLNKTEELYDIGFEDYLYDNRYCFIEWPQIGESLLPEETIRLQISVMPDGTRIIREK